MLNIFKNYAAKTSILDDFDFYENREKVMVQKKLRFPPVLKVLSFSSLLSPIHSLSLCILTIKLSYVLDYRRKKKTWLLILKQWRYLIQPKRETQT